jgi:hypothetical protein
LDGTIVGGIDTEGFHEGVSDGFVVSEGCSVGVNEASAVVVGLFDGNEGMMVGSGVGSTILTPSSSMATTFCNAGLFACSLKAATYASRSNLAAKGRVSTSSGVKSEKELTRYDTA